MNSKYIKQLTMLHEKSGYYFSTPWGSSSYTFITGRTGGIKYWTNKNAALAYIDQIYGLDNVKIIDKTN